MSLASKWNNHLKEILEDISPNGIEKQEFDRIKRAFYAGAEAYDQESDNPNTLRAEIDHFKAGKP